ncbi:hypothetical protein CEXT_203591 [Caerostris extrusa]|uniref:Uncharacterized protein n=1 Tax=Caerostris extrusa TaxID=172846 RepID=A0AAV4N652_CAEEX|nr:hypothetical protein CEXT_203591 [Caerostris extrusa]
MLCHSEAKLTQGLLPHRWLASGPNPKLRDFFLTSKSETRFKKPLTSHAFPSSSKFTHTGTSRFHLQKKAEESETNIIIIANQGVLKLPANHITNLHSLPTVRKHFELCVF